MEDLIRQAEGSNTLRAGLASKMFGLMNFLEQGMYGRVGCGGLAALCDRQESRETVITDELRIAFTSSGLSCSSVPRDATGSANPRFLAS